MTETIKIDWARGDHFGLDLPAHPQALELAGPDFLTRALRASGAIAPDNQVIEVNHFEEWHIGGTGSKAILSLVYKHEEPGLPEDIFAKFSRNFTDRTRDSVRYYMEPEIRLANLSREPGFPIAVPKCLYADFHHETGTGILLTERIPYGQGLVEPHYPKCMDQIVLNPLAHYRVLISALALLAGTHKSGGLGKAMDSDFPLCSEAMVANGRIRYDVQQLADRVDRLADFIKKYPHLFPQHIAEKDFLDRFCADAPLFIAQQDAIWRFFLSSPDMIALCHRNANIDNAWFWKEPDETLKCGLIDWGSVGQMHVCQTIWGSVACAEPDMIDQHLDELVDLFVTDYARAGGPTLEKAKIQQHLGLGVMIAGLGSMMNAPRAILRQVPDPSLVTDRYDPIFSVNETARVQLKVTINFLDMWYRRDMGGLLRAKQFG